MEYDVLCIQETLLKSKDKFFTKGYKIFRKDIAQPGERGIVVLVRENILCEHITLEDVSHPTVEYQIIKLQLKNLESIAIVNIYRHSGTLTPLSFYKLLINAIDGAEYFLLLGDFNAHHSAWGSRYQTLAGRRLFQIIEEQNLIVLNDCTPTLLHPSPTVVSVIDLAISSPSLAPLCDLVVGGDTHGSDHYPVITTLHSQPLLKSKFCYRIPLNKEQYSMLLQNLSSRAAGLPLQEEKTVLDRYNALVDSIMEEARAFVPEHKRFPRSSALKSKHDSPPWWNASCSEAVRTRRDAIRRLVSCPSKENLYEFNKARKSCSKILSEQKRLGWKKFVGEFNSKTPTAQIWGLIKCFKRRSSSSSPGCSSQELRGDSLNMINKLCPPSAFFDCSKSVEDMRKDDLSTSYVCEWLDAPLSSREFTSALSSVRRRSAPGLDQLDFEMLSHLPAEYESRLLDIFNQIFSQGVFPDSWRQSLVVLIPKSTGGVRPISLMSCVCKLMERILYSRLRWFVESGPVLPQSQSGFRPFRSCDDNLAALTTRIRAGFLCNSPTVAVFLDIASAFDNVDPHILLSDLETMGVPAQFRKFVENLISYRHLSFVVNGEILGPFQALKGTPQGSTLSPLLFDLYLSSINQHIHQDTRILQYADDLVLFSTHRNLETAIESVQCSLSKICEFLRFRNLEVSCSKTKWIIFKSGLPAKISSSLNIYGEDIPRVDVHRFLGVLLDHNLSGKRHLRYLVQKGRKIADIVSVLSGVAWGSHPELLLTVYRSTFRSAVEYGCQFFTWKPTNRDFVKLQRLQYRIIRRAMGYRITTPINVMLAEAKEINFDFRLNLTASKFIYKAMACKFSPVYSSLEEMEIVAIGRNRKVEAVRGSRLFRSFVLSRHEKSIIHRSTYPPAFWHTYESSSKSITFIKNMHECDKDSNPALIRAEFYHKSFQYRQGAASFYTDGSKSLEGAVGAAVFSPDTGGAIEHRLPPETSVFSAELWAIYQALLAVGDLEIDRSIIFSDSESALEALQSNKALHRNYLIYYIKQAYCDLIKKGRSITLFWVPAHVGIPGNESADHHAKQASSGTYRPYFRVPYEDLLANASARAARQQDEYMKEISINKGTRYYAHFYKHSRKTWFHDLTLPRQDIVHINRLRANHVNTNESLHRLGIVESAACPCGDPCQSINHLIFHCSEFNLNSLPIRRYLSQKFPESSQDLLPALSSPTPKLSRLILAYMKANNLFF